MRWQAPTLSYNGGWNGPALHAMHEFSVGRDGQVARSIRMTFGGPCPYRLLRHPCRPNDSAGQPPGQARTTIARRAIPPRHTRMRGRGVRSPRSPSASQAWPGSAAPASMKGRSRENTPPWVWALNFLLASVPLFRTGAPLFRLAFAGFEVPVGRFVAQVTPLVATKHLFGTRGPSQFSGRTRGHTQVMGTDGCAPSTSRSSSTLPRNLFVTLPRVRASSCPTLGGRLTPCGRMLASGCTPSLSSKVPGRWPLPSWQM